MSGTAERLPSGTVTFVFTDVEGSTRLFRLLGDSFVPLLDAHHAILRREIEASGGAVVKTEGDGTFAAFGSASDALAACRRAQRSLAAHPWPEGAELRVRMGLHTGTATPTGGDYVALPVHQAARVTDAAHGGQVLVTSATRAQLPAEAPLRELGRFRLRDFDEPETLFDLEEGEPCPPPRALPAAAHNFPRSRSSFVGRDADLQDLRELLPQTSLLTLVGTGGMGKTRLAREAAIAVVDQFPEGAWLVELASLSGAEQVLPAIANALAIRETPGEDLQEALVDRLRDASLLLTLDNCEHVLDPTAEVVDAILDSAPAVRILATSQERLGVAGERIWPVAPLAVPSDANGSNGSGHGAVQLFVERAATARPGFKLDETNAAAVVDVCRRLDGLPLAIELAAARVSALSPKQISERLDQRFDLLSGGERGAISRHRTLRAAIEWSCDLLPELERVALRRISVFAGPFSLEGAEAVVRGEDIQVTAVAGLIQGLVEHSLLEVRDDDRYLALETVREYGRILLSEAGEEAPARDRHLEWVVAAIARREGEPEESWYGRIDAEYDELRSALSWGLEGGDPAVGLRAVALTGSFLADRAHTAEGRAWVDALLERAGSADLADRAAVLAISSRLAFVAGDFETAQRCAEEGLGAANELGDRGRACHFLRLLGNVALYEGRVGEARDFYMKALEAGPELSRIRAKFNLGLAEVMLGNLDAAEEQATALLEQTRRKYPSEAAFAQSLLAMVAAEREDGLATAGYVTNVIDGFRATSNLYELAESVEMAGAACLFEGEAEDAAWLLGASDCVYEAAGAVRPEGFFATRYDRWVHAARAALGEERFGQLADAGREADPDAAVEAAARKLAGLLSR